MKSNYDTIIDSKYKYQGDPSKLNFENYNENDEMRKLSNSELLALQQKKLESKYNFNKGQDQQIDELVLKSKQGQNLGKEISKELDKQNKLLGDVEKDVYKN